MIFCNYKLYRESDVIFEFQRNFNFFNCDSITKMYMLKIEKLDNDLFIILAKEKGDS